MARTDTLGHFLTDVADAIREKGGTSEEITASDFDTAIENLPSGGSGLGDYINLNPSDTSNTGTGQEWWQRRMVKPTMADAEIVLAQSAVGIAGMFNGCKWSYIPKISTTQKHTNFNMTQAFYNCARVTSLDLSNLEATVSRISTCFYGCTDLMFLDIRKLEVSGITSSGYMSSAFNYVPTTCEIIVKDATEKAWFTTNFSTLTNVKTVAEYEAE